MATAAAAVIDGAVPECVWDVGAQLGEGPLWMAQEQALWFVDIKGRQIHRYHEPTGAKRSWPCPEEVGFIVPLARGQFIVGMQSGLHRFDPANGSFSLIAAVDSHLPHNRLNDGFVDAAGRLWFGTMDNHEQAPTGSLYCFDQRGLRCCDEGYVITNGPAACPQNRTLYHIDTLQRLIYAFEVDETGELSARRVFAEIDKPGAYPDGPTVDAAGFVWVGLFGGWGVRRYPPQGGVPETIDLPVANCTKVTFGGDDLRTLYITTAWKGLSAEERARQPLAGGLFRIRTQTPGLPQNAVRVTL